MITVLVVLLMGALAVGLARLIVKPEPGARASLFGMLVILLLIAGQFVGYKYVRPRAQAMIAGQTLDDQPLYRTLRKYEPAIYERLERGFKTAVKTGKQEEFMQTAIGEVAQLAQKHLSKASDKSINDFMAHAVVQLKALQHKPNDACFRMLFPQVAGTADFSVLPKSMVDANATYLEAVLISAIEHPQPPPPEQETMTVLKPILMSMAQRYGQDLQMLGRPAAATGSDRGRVCEISIDLYDQILALPDDQSADVLRLMISKV